MSIRGVKVDHTTIQRWVFNFTPLVEQQFRKRKKIVEKRWSYNETNWFRIVVPVKTILSIIKVLRGGN